MRRAAPLDFEPLVLKGHAWSSQSGTRPGVEQLKAPVLPRRMETIVTISTRFGKGPYQRSRLMEFYPAGWMVLAGGTLNCACKKGRFDRLSETPFWMTLLEKPVDIENEMADVAT